MIKQKRFDAIISIIDEFEIDTQEELTSKLNEKGFKISQATVSRDINDLGLIKINGNFKKFKYAKPLNYLAEIPQNLINIFKQVCISIANANNLVVIKTMSGNANAAASVIDQMKLNNILGSIAGDDTLLLIAKSQKDAEDTVKNLKSI